MDDDLLQLLQEEMATVVEGHKKKLSKLRTGRASLAMLDGVRVEYYGSTSPLRQVATLAIPEPRLVTISPWDKAVIPSIVRGILKSDLGLNPSSDGKMVRLMIPELTGDRRKTLVRQVKKIAEEARIGIRAKRREYLDEVKSQEKAKEISEDDEKRYQVKIQEITDTYVKLADSESSTKEEEILET